MARQRARQERGIGVTEQVRPPVGSVAEETARLLEALLAGDGTGGVTAHGAAAADSTTNSGEESASSPSSEGSSAEGAASPGPCPSCGRVAGETDRSVCHLCPLCQLITAVRSVNPQTVDRLADLAAAVSQSLRDLAASRWAQSGRPPPHRRGTAVDDITVGEDDGELLT